MLRNARVAPLSPPLSESSLLDATTTTRNRRPTLSLANCAPRRTRAAFFLVTFSTASRVVSMSSSKFICALFSARFDSSNSSSCARAQGEAGDGGARSTAALSGARWRASDRAPDKQRGDREKNDARVTAGRGTGWARHHLLLLPLPVPLRRGAVEAAFPVQHGLLALLALLRLEAERGELSLRLADARLLRRRLLVHRCLRLPLRLPRGLPLRLARGLARRPGRAPRLRAPQRRRGEVRPTARGDRTLAVAPGQFALFGEAVDGERRGDRGAEGAVALRLRRLRRKGVVVRLVNERVELTLQVRPAPHAHQNRRTDRPVRASPPHPPTDRRGTQGIGAH